MARSDGGAGGRGECVGRVFDKWNAEVGCAFQRSGGGARYLYGWDESVRQWEHGEGGEYAASYRESLCRKRMQAARCKWGIAGFKRSNARKASDAGRKKWCDGMGRIW